jgi:hypothetical protein
MNRHKFTTRAPTTECLLCSAPNGGVKVEVLLSNETI